MLTFTNERVDRNLESLDLKVTGNLKSKLSWARCNRYCRHDRLVVVAIFIAQPKQVRLEIVGGHLVPPAPGGPIPINGKIWVFYLIKDIA